MGTIKSTTASSPSGESMHVECQCGNVSFDLPYASPVEVYHCHCTECQRQSASAFGTTAIFPADAVFPIDPALEAKLQKWTRQAKEGRTMDCYFCKECGVRVFHRIIHADGTPRPTVSLKGGLVEGLDWSNAKHIYVESAVFPVPDGAEWFPTTPEAGVPGSDATKRLGFEGGKVIEGIK